jgi:ABC-type transporter Mla MlaB component
MEALSGHDSVILDCADATEIDVAFVQILVAASRAATRSNKRIELKRPPDGVLAEALRRCGFSQPRAATTSLAEALSL